MLFKVFSFFTYIIFDNHEIIFKNGEKLEKTFNLIYFRRQYRRKNTGYFEAKRYEFLYENGIFENKSITLIHNLIAECDCIITELALDNFQEVLDRNLEKIQKTSLEMKI